MCRALELWVCVCPAVSISSPDHEEATPSAAGPGGSGAAQPWPRAGTRARSLLCPAHPWHHPAVRPVIPAGRIIRGHFLPCETGPALGLCDSTLHTQLNSLFLTWLVFWFSHGSFLSWKKWTFILKCKKYQSSFFCCVRTVTQFLLSVWAV